MTEQNTVSSLPLFDTCKSVAVLASGEPVRAVS